MGNVPIKGVFEYWRPTPVEEPDPIPAPEPARPPIAPADMPIVGEGDGMRAYHLNLKPADLADYVIIVGDPDRATAIAKRFFLSGNQTEVFHRGLRTITGITRAGTRVTVTTSGMGTPSLEIVFNELVILREINLKTREPIVPRPPPLTVIRVGTSGALRADTPLGTAIISAYGIGLDGAGLYYDVRGDVVLERIERMTYQAINADVPKNCRYCELLPLPYAARADPVVVRELWDSAKMLAVPSRVGITVSAGGFFANQGRRPVWRLRPTVPDIDTIIGAVEYGENPGDICALNMEMEAAMLLHLGSAAGYRCAAVCTTVAQRVEGKFLADSAPAVDAAAAVVIDAIDRMAKKVPTGPTAAATSK
jgi:uridine phosphorylase